MATAHLPLDRPVVAKVPFLFNSGSNLLRIGKERAHNLVELQAALRTCPDASIFQHTFQTLQEHHYIREGFINDFAHWAFAHCNETGLAERLAGIDVREFTSIRALRERLVQIVDDYLQKNPRVGERVALEPFYFCSSETVVVPTSHSARTLPDFIEGIREVSVHAIHFHFITARLRLRLNSNDFSVWLEEELGMSRLAARINRIDIYTSTMEGVRRSILKVLQEAAE